MGSTKDKLVVLFGVVRVITANLCERPGAREARDKYPLFSITPCILRTLAGYDPIRNAAHHPEPDQLDNLASCKWDSSEARGKAARTCNATSMAMNVIKISFVMYCPRDGSHMLGVMYSASHVALIAKMKSTCRVTNQETRNTTNATSQAVVCPR